MAALLHDHCSISLSFKMICNFSLQKKNMGKTQQGPKIHLRWKVDIRNLFSVTVIEKLAFRNRLPSGVFQILEVLCYPLNISHLTGTRESEDWLLSKMNRNTGADLGGGCRGCPPWDDLRFSNTTGFLQKKWFIGVEVEQETSAPPPKKNPGSAHGISAKEFKHDASKVPAVPVAVAVPVYG